MRQNDHRPEVMTLGTAADLYRLLGSEVTGARRVQGGYTPAARRVVEFSDGRTAFVKHAVHESIAARLRREYEMYRSLSGTWLPEVIAFQDGEQPMLVLEDLSQCDWPPPWSQDRVEAVRATLAEVAVQPAPDGVGTIADAYLADCGWPEVARDPTPFLNLGLCSREWLEGAMPTLLNAAAPALLDGKALCHLDVRSDNLCFRSDGQAVLIDWDCAAVGNPEFDLAFWLPSLQLEGGPEPQSVAAITPGIVAIVAGFFASEAGLPVIPHAPNVRDIQLRQLEVALPWAATVLGLPVPQRSTDPVHSSPR